MHRFFLDNSSLGKGELTIENEDLVYQIFKVLRFRVGEELMLFNGSGKNYVYRISDLNKKTVRVEFVEMIENNAYPKRKIRLFFSMTKSMEKMEFVLQKCTEIGVVEFFPLISQRSERRVLEKKERLYRILKEATEQCGGDEIPLLHEEISFSNALALNEFSEKRFIAQLGGEEIDLNNFENLQNIDLFIGPEGGFSDEECALAEEFGLISFSFGKRVLRAETACVVFSGLFMS